MVYVRTENREPGYFAIEDPVWVRLQSNGSVVRCEEEDSPGGILCPHGSEIWQLEGNPSLGGGYPVAVRITTAEYEEWECLRNQSPDPDPEDTDPEIPEGTDPATILTRAELTIKVTELDEALQLLLSGVTEDE